MQIGKENNAQSVEQHSVTMLIGKMFLTHVKPADKKRQVKEKQIMVKGNIAQHIKPHGKSLCGALSMTRQSPAE